MKIAEKYQFQDDKLLIKKTHSATPALNAARQLRDAGKQSVGDSKVIGVVPFAMWVMWAKMHGVDPADSDAMREVVDREMQNPDNKKLRIWEGTY